MKLFKIFGVLMLLFALTAANASASDYAMTSLKVNGEAPVGSLAVQPGEVLDVKVAIKGLTGIAKDVKVKAWLGGYEYGVVQEETPMFRVRNGVTYVKSLNLQLPEDLSTVSNLYKLHVEVFDAVNVVERTFDLFVEEARHDINVQDVIIMPSEINAGGRLYAKVRLENVGYKTEDDIMVEVSMPELGVSARTYVDKLYPRNAEDNSQTANTLVLNIPRDTSTATYEMNVKVVYNNGHSVVHETKLVNVQGKTSNKDQSKAIVSVVAEKDLKLDTKQNYKVMVANLDDEDNTYVLEISNVEWAELNLASNVLSLDSKQTGELNFELIPKSEGSHSFNLKLKENGIVILDRTLNVNVQKEKTKLPWLTILGALLLVVLVFVVISQMQGEKFSKDEIEKANKL